MNVVVSRLDIKTTRENWPSDIAFSPALVQAKQPGQPEEWLVVDRPVTQNEPPSIACTVSDQYIRIPLFVYSLSPKADLALAEMVQIGISCVGHILKPVKTLHVVSGNPVDLLYGDDINTPVGLRYWFGFAFSTER
jgi:hypothetical protein